MNHMIRAQDVGKRYRIGRRDAPYATLRESISRAARAPLDRLRGTSRKGTNAGTADDHFWALRELNFEIEPGEVVGILGRNGAGKSTLLKVLSRITEPTSGRIELFGRIGSLLEVGTGFHPELTGRENITLNGAILGMSRREILRKFDEIVAFAGVERFIDTPVKRYSSGMYMRLAFAVAAHLETEILLVDEVLAVGDANFQKKCLGKLEEVGSLGRTVLFVSHSMPMILRLCTRALLLDQGTLVADGTPTEISQRYSSSETGSQAERTWPDLDRAPGDSVAKLSAVRVLDDEGQVSEVIDIHRPFQVEVEYVDLVGDARPTVSIHFINDQGITLFVNNDYNNRDWFNTPRTPGLVRARCQVPGNFLAEGQIFVLAAVCTYNPDTVHALERDAVSFQVVDQSDGAGVRGVFAGYWPGVVRPMLQWTVDSVPPAAISSPEIR